MHNTGDPTTVQKHSATRYNDFKLLAEQLPPASRRTGLAAFPGVWIPHVGVDDEPRKSTNRAR